jgi:hypothetical protein
MLPSLLSLVFPDKSVEEKPKRYNERDEKHDGIKEKKD